ncbi:flavin reductase family protein [Vreelandella sedimenti]|uniref:flavin reductase family protein n=1 Tax=Vreelandella sedimenti TaxID=2729618 RepID=UPI00257FF807|nr:flavin reductase family protein [Halomonas sp. UBA3173]|tara:strand:- start:16128 stop:16688 length:561 start_codon:yes stop_codon:yes gene_type:complete
MNIQASTSTNTKEKPLIDNSLDSKSAELSDQFKGAMRRFTSSVAIIATSEGNVSAGMVATAVISVSTAPPALLICVNRSASLHAPLLQQRRFSVNLLSATQADLIPIFAGQVKGSARFEYGQWKDVDGLPLLQRAQSNLICILEKIMSYGSHDVIIGRVQTVQFLEQVNPLLWENGQPAISKQIAQ